MSKGKSRDGRDRLTFEVGGLRKRLRAQAILSEGYANEPNQPLASIIRMALLEWLSDRESRNSDQSHKS